jgi:hypothetical protein
LNTLIIYHVPDNNNIKCVINCMHANPTTVLIHVTLQTLQESNYWLIHSFHPCTCTKTTWLANGNFLFHTQHWKDLVNKHNLVQHLHKLQIGTICFIISVCLIIHTEQLSSHRTDFQEIWYVSNFWESVEKIHITLTRMVLYTEMYIQLW